MADVVIGHDRETGESVFLSEEGRRLFTYVIGNIGTGKSGLLEQIARQDMANDGLCFLDPHEDSAEKLLRYVPEHRRHDAIFWDPTDRAHPFGLNPFSCPNPDDIDSKASNFIAALESLEEFTLAFANAPRMRSILRHLTLAFILNQGTTLAETPRFLTNHSFRRRFYDAIPDEYDSVRAFWERYDRRPEREQRELSDSSLNKLERFQIDRTMRGIFGQPENAIDFRQAMDTGKIVIVKLSSHRLGKDNAAFIGAFVVWEIFQAALSRSDTPEQHRRQFHLIGDEFATYMTTAFPQLIEQARKFGVDVSVAHQRRDQIPQGSRNAPLVAGNKIVFGISGHDAMELAKEFKIEVPEPAVSGERQKYALTPHPLQHLATQGHENIEVLSAYRNVQQCLNVYFDQILTFLSPFTSYVPDGHRKVQVHRDRCEDRIDQVLFMMMTNYLQDGTLFSAQSIRELLMDEFKQAAARAFLPESQSVNMVHHIHEYWEQYMRETENGTLKTERMLESTELSWDFRDNHCAAGLLYECFHPDLSEIYQDCKEQFGNELRTFAQLAQALESANAEWQRVFFSGFEKIESFLETYADEDRLDKLIPEEEYDPKYHHRLWPRWFQRIHSYDLLYDEHEPHDIMRYWEDFCPGRGSVPRVAAELLDEIRSVIAPYKAQYGPSWWQNRFVPEVYAWLQQKAKGLVDQTIGRMSECVRSYHSFDPGPYHLAKFYAYQDGENPRGTNYAYSERWKAVWWLFELEQYLANNTYELGSLLCQFPAYSSTGQLEPILDKPRLYSDVEAEIANTLATLPRYTARCTLIQNGNQSEYTINTIEPPLPDPDTDERAGNIKVASRHEYGRSRALVERELRQRLSGRQPARTAPDDVRDDQDEAGDFWYEDA